MAGEPLAHLQQGLFDELFEAVPDCLAVVDRGLRFVRVNSATSLKLGRPIRGFAGKTIEDVLGDSAHGIEPLVLRALAGETVRDVEVQDEACAVGYTVSLVPLQPSKAEPPAGVLMIISHRPETGRERFTREQLEMILAGTRVGIFDWHSSSDEVRWSEGMGPLFGRDAGWAPPGYAAYQAVLHPSDRETLHADVRRAMDEGTGFDREFRAIWPDGSTHWLHSRVEAIPGDDGSTVLLGIVTDIDRRKRREQAETLLSTIGRDLGSALGLEQTLDQLAQTLARSFGGWCETLTLDESREVAMRCVAHCDPSLTPVAQRVQELTWSGESVPRRLEVLRGGETYHRRDIDEERLRAFAVDDEHEELLLELAPREALTVPMIARGRLLGALSLYSGPPEPNFDPELVELAEEIGRRAAVAVDNARLLEAEQTANRALRHLQAVSDATLDNLELDDLLDELMRRVTQLTVAEFGVVLLTDYEQGDLVLRTVSGLSGLTVGEFRMGFGEGIAGAVFEMGEPLYIEDLAESRYSSRIGEQVGQAVRSVLAVPLLAHDTIVGVLQVGTISATRPFSDPDIELLRLVAERAGRGIVNASLYERARETADLLQASLLPASLPEIPGFEVAAMYRPGQELTEVGGDWYDVFVLPDGRYAAAIGDVVGRGVSAAAIMGQLRAATRAYALEHGDPATVLTLVDALVEDLVAVPFATVILLVLDPQTGSVDIASAGHPPPVLRSSGLLEVDGGPALGAPAEGRPPSTRVALAPGETMLIYTDGMVERRSELLQDRLERLAAEVASGPVPPAELLEHLETVMLGADSRDDAAAVALSRVA